MKSTAKGTSGHHIIYPSPEHPEQEVVVRVRKFRKKDKCRDCGVAITKGYQRCRPCASKVITPFRKMWEDPGFRSKMTAGRMGHGNPNWRGGKWKSEDSILRKIRNSKKYMEWKDYILMRDVKSYPKIPKNIQVHHLTSLGSIVHENRIKTIEDAARCPALWDTDNGVALTAAEHLIITWMNRMKKHSPGFISYIEDFIALNKDKAKEV